MKYLFYTNVYYSQPPNKFLIINIFRCMHNKMSSSLLNVCTLMRINLQHYQLNLHRAQMIPMIPKLFGHALLLFKKNLMRLLIIPTIQELRKRIEKPNPMLRSNNRSILITRLKRQDRSN